MANLRAKKAVKRICAWRTSSDGVEKIMGLCGCHPFNRQNVFSIVEHGEKLVSGRGRMCEKILLQASSSFYPGGGGVLYVSSKHALVGTVKQLAFELAPDIRVNAVAPGGTRTSLGGLEASGDRRSLAEIPGFDAMVAKTVPLGFLSEPQDHAGLYVTLAARSESRFVTSEIIRSDGGLMVRGGGRKRKETA